MTRSDSQSVLSRRTAISGIGAGGLAVGLALANRQVSAQGGDLADHPMTGTWMTLVNPLLPDGPQVPHISTFTADGIFMATVPLSDIGPDGPVLQSAMVGIWEAYDDRRAHFTASQTLSDFNGNVVGMVTVDGYPVASEDGASFSDDGELVTITIRDPQGAVIDSFPGAGAERPVRGMRLTPGNTAFPEPLVAGAATPTA